MVTAPVPLRLTQGPAPPVSPPRALAAPEDIVGGCSLPGCAEFGCPPLPSPPPVSPPGKAKAASPVPVPSSHAPSQPGVTHLAVQAAPQVTAPRGRGGEGGPGEVSAERGWPGKGDPLLSPRTEGSPQSWVGRGKGGPRCPSPPYGEGVPCQGGPRGEGDPLSAPHPPQSGGQQIRGGPPLYPPERHLHSPPVPPTQQSSPPSPHGVGLTGKGGSPFAFPPPHVFTREPPPGPPSPRASPATGAPPLPPPSGIHQGAPPFPPLPTEGCPSPGVGGGWGGPCGGFPDAEQGVDLCFSFKSHLSPQVLAQESLATGVTGVMVPAGTVTQPLLIPISIAGQVTGQQALALVTIPTATLAALPGLTPAAPAGAIFKPPVANLTGNRR